VKANFNKQLASHDYGNNEGTGKTKSSADNGEAKSKI
jgi:hypothetical protein